ncbi:hypothetical protein [Amycolatopsis granulosa]|nr:hypothetical protein [Amycolatopsis granulosa]NIH84289.1 hypothetical protein [Amycolatopsis granulosa]
MHSAVRRARLLVGGYLALSVATLAVAAGHATSATRCGCGR